MTAQNREGGRHVQQVVILSLAEKRDGCGDACGCGPADKAADKAAEPARVPVLSCADALRAEGLQVELVAACSDAEIDAAVKPAETGEALLVVAAATDGELRAVVRRMVRHHAPPPSLRPAELPAGRTVFDLPPLAVLPLHPSVPELVTRLGLPRDPAEVAAAVKGGRVRQMDLLRNDGGSVTMHSSLLGGLDAQGSVGIWHGRVEVDDAVLADGDEPLIACAIGNAGSTELDGLPLLTQAAPDDGVVDVAVAIPVVRQRLLRSPSVEFEVRRAKGRAVSVTPRDGADLHLVDDGVSGILTRKRSWWVEPAAWAAYVM
jgi:hypothetical protein